MSFSHRYKPISGPQSLSMLPENIGKPDDTFLILHISIEKKHFAEKD